jgi:hypothetical protein
MREMFTTLQGILAPLHSFHKAALFVVITRR